MSNTVPGGRPRRIRTALSVTALSLALVASPVMTGSVAAQSFTFFSVLTPARQQPDNSNRMVLGIDGASTAARARAILARHSAGAPNQQWQRIPVSGAGGDLIKNQKSGLCLDKSQDTPDAPGNAVYQYPCNSNAANQIWYSERDPNASNGNWKRLRNRASSLCLDVRGPNNTNGEVLHMWTCYSTWSQQWNIE